MFVFVYKRLIFLFFSLRNYVCRKLMFMQDYRKLQIWNLSMEIAVDIYKKVDQLHIKDQIAIGSHLQKSGISIPSNIAEGCARKSGKEFSRFLDIAQGSAFELETQIEIARRCKVFDEQFSCSVLDRLAALKSKIYKFNNAVSVGYLTHFLTFALGLIFAALISYSRDL